ncbi:hypothetical protein ACHHYP_10106 [Achlya hypogyna]|uniref:Uncharacterized protein n=1 Tax=Achlya hypogyna TaxID=1202772 RepID=A0A1V9ZIE4_ACHHY|nr:hypothetical protein ACHHYP_10106 [Achlya hypogyna]
MSTSVPASREIDVFERTCGMTLRGYKIKGHATPKPAVLHLDTTKSALGATTAIDPAFVPSRSEKKPKKSKPALPARSNQSPDTKPPKARHRQSAKAPVDFVYDVDVRKELRAALDEERKGLLQQAQARERALRDANLWLYDRRQPHSPRKTKGREASKECWTTSCDTRPACYSTEVKDDMDDEIIWTKPAPATSKKARPSTAKGKRNSVAENVHWSAPQTQSYHDGRRGY